MPDLETLLERTDQILNDTAPKVADQLDVDHVPPRAVPLDILDEIADDPYIQ